MRLASILLALLAAPAASGWDLTIDAALPEGGDCALIGAWDAVEQSCTTSDLTLGPQDVLTIESGRLILTGETVNAGLIDSRDRLFIGEPTGYAGAFHNLGTLLSGAEAEITIRMPACVNARGARLEHLNDLTWSADLDCVLDNAGEVDGTDLILYGVTNRAGGIVRLRGDSLLWTEFRNHGELRFESGWWEVEGTIRNEADGLVAIEGGFLNLYRTIINHGRFDDFGIVGVNNGIFIDNHGAYYNHDGLSDCEIGTFRNFGRLDNLSDASLCATLFNEGVVNNPGAIVELNPLFYLGAVDNAGTIADCGTLTAPLTGEPAIADTDADGDLRCDALDCDPADGSTWARPGPVRRLRLSRDASTGETSFSWEATLYPGGDVVVPSYEVLRSTDASDLTASGTTSCVAVSLLTPEWEETSSPALGELFFFVARDSNPCGPGELADDRPALDCG